MNYLRVDLKVCEVCGALWLRSETTTGAYCRHCTLRLADFPKPRERRKTGLRRKSTHGAGQAAAKTTAKDVTKAVGGAR